MMKTRYSKIGILGGLGPEATIEYYRLFTELFRKRDPSGAYPQLVIHSMDLQEFFEMAEKREWARIVEWLAEGVDALGRAGADFAVIASNTPHIVFHEVETRVAIPMISIVHETLRVAEDRNFKRLGLFGTKFTMAATFYQDAAAARGIEVFVPGQADQNYIHGKLVEEIGVGTILDETRAGLVEIIGRIKDSHGIEGLILGCTELPLILKNDEGGVVLLNTTRIHVQSAVDRCFVNPE
jgi:aspartate racemase